MANHRAIRERTSGPIRAGHRVARAGSPGRVLIVLGTSIPADRAPEDEWVASKSGEGDLLVIEGVELVLEADSDEDPDLIARARPQECS